MLHLLAQLHKKLQLDYKTNITENGQKIELYESPTSKDFKKPLVSRQVGGSEMWRWMERYGEVIEQALPHSHVVDKNWKGYLGSEQSQQDCIAQDSSARKINPYNFWL